MSSDHESIVLADPVCGRSVDPSSRFRHVHGGALFCFCGEDCRARFAAHPTRHSFLVLSGSRVAPPVDDAPDTAPMPDSAPIPDAGPAPGRSEAPAPRGPFRPLRSWFERRVAARCCRRLLHAYRRVASEQPALARVDLYRAAVEACKACDARTAQAVLVEAEESYASWPVKRALCLRDVAHYVAISEIFLDDLASEWAEADIRRVVDRVVPAGL
jgi:YHS domain-containing protein